MTYTSGRARVHRTIGENICRASIAEYGRFVRDNPDHKLAPDLARCVTDLREELQLRETDRLACEPADGDVDLSAGGDWHRWPTSLEARDEVA